MREEGKRRPPRIPLTPEEVAELVTIKKIREYNKLLIFKKSLTYKFLNCFNVFCFFVFCELLISFYGPCNYRLHYSKNVKVIYSNKQDNIDKDGRRKISDIVLVDVNDHKYNLSINDFIEAPSKFTVFKVGKDFLMQRELKVLITTSPDYYRIQNASPILFLSIFLGVFCLIFFSYNLNQNGSSLTAISVINGITILAFFNY